MTDLEDPRPTIGERYIRATHAKNLRVGEHNPAADMILAAAMQHNPLGTLLFRLQSEYDQIKVEIGNAEDRALALRREADTIERLPKEIAGLPPLFDAHVAAWRAARAGLIRKRSEADIVAARSRILQRLRSLDEAKVDVGIYAIELAKKQRFHRGQEIVLRLAWEVIGVFLDPICATCDGTGVKGSAYRGEEEKPCTACRLTGQRRYRMGKDDTDRWFADILLGRLQAAMAAAAGEIGALLKKD